MIQQKYIQFQAAKAVEVISVLYQAIAAAGDQGVPSGHLYAMRMSAFSSLEGYESCIALMVRTGMVLRTGHVLTATALPSAPKPV